MKDDDKTFDGKTYKPSRDKRRLTSQYTRIFELMKDGAWRTPDEIAAKLGLPRSDGITARMRDYRKPRNGAHEVNTRHRGDVRRGLVEYQLVVRSQS